MFIGNLIENFKCLFFMLIFTANSNTPLSRAFSFQSAVQSISPGKWEVNKTPCCSQGFWIFHKSLSVVLSREPQRATHWEIFGRGTDWQFRLSEHRPERKILCCGCLLSKCLLQFVSSPSSVSWFSSPFLTQDHGFPGSGGHRTSQQL